MSFRGRYECKIDSKGRLSLPAGVRQSLHSDETAQFVITNGLFQKKRCLDVYTYDEWVQLENRISSMPALKSEVQAYRRFYLASGQTVSCDSQNRMLIPSGLRKYAGIEEDLVLVGMGHKMEIWPASTWNELYEGMADQFEDIVSTVADMEGVV